MAMPAGAGRLFSPVLCAVDFSDHSRIALQFAAAMARRAGAPLQVLFVNDPLLVAAAAAAYGSGSAGAATEIELRRFAASTLSPRALKAAAPQYTIALGKPAREILRVVSRNRSGIVVLGTKGLNGARRLVLGSTTAEVLRRARVPVLAVPPAATPDDRPTIAAGWPGRKVVAAIELGPRAAADVERAADVARSFDARLILTHIVPMPVAPYWFSVDLDAHLRRDCEKAEAALDALSEALDVRSTLSVRVGHPPDEIAATARDHNAGLIVMALRGTAGLFGEPAGSCAYQVLCHRVAPVLALPDLRRAAGTRQPR